MSGARHICVISNSGWSLVNFRKGLIRHLIAQGHRVTTISDDHPRLQEIAALGATVIRQPINAKGTSPIDDLRYAQGILRHLKKLKPGVVLSVTIKPNIYGGLAAKWLGIPLIPNITGLGASFQDDGALNRLVTGLYRIALPRNGPVCFQNSEDRDLLVLKGLVRREQAIVLPGSGVDLEHFAQMPLPDGPFRFLHAARLLKSKGIEEFARAASLMRESHPHVRFAIAGPLLPDDDDAVSSSEINRWTENGLIDFLGPLDDIRPAIANAHCIVLPSRYREGTPRILLEAAAMGRPLITTDTPGCKDTAVAGVNGWLVPPADVIQLCFAMREAAELPTTDLQKMGEASRNIAREKFSEAIVFDAYDAAITGTSKT